SNQAHAECEQRRHSRNLRAQWTQCIKTPPTSPLIFGLMTGIARASETPAAVSRTWPLIARICRPRRQVERAQQTRFDHRTKAEHPATILLPNPVAADDTERHATDRPVKIRRQINTRWGGGSPAAI